MNVQISKFIVPVLLIAVGLAAAMFILPVVGAILIGIFALSGLIWLSSKVFGFFQGGADYSEENPSDGYESGAGARSGKHRIISKKWNKSQVVEAEIITEEKSVKKD